MKITIPPAALEAGKRAALEADTNIHDQLIAAFEATVTAWPDMAHRVMPYAALILPLTETSTKENDNG